MEAVTGKRGNLDRHLHENAQRVSNGDNVEREFGLIRCDGGIDDERRDDDDVVRHRRDRRP